MFQKTQTNCIFMSPNFAIHRPQNEFWYFWCLDITETGIHRSSVSRIISKDLRLKCFKRHHPQKLTDANCTTRIKRANLKLLLQNNFPEFWHWLCLGRKVFSIASPDNRQNDLVYAPRYMSSARCTELFPSPATCSISLATFKNAASVE